MSADIPSDTFLARLLQDEANLAAMERRHHFLDAIACELHNRGYQLDGNTEESDVRWFARHLYDRLHDECFPYSWGSWRAGTEQQQETFMKLAAVVLVCIPAIQSRIAHRLVAVSKAVRLMADAARRDAEQARERRVKEERKERGEA